MQSECFIQYFGNIFWKCLSRFRSNVPIYFNDFQYSAGSTPAGIYLLKVDNKNTRTSCEICSKLTIKTPERHHDVMYRVVCETLSKICSGAFQGNSQQLKAVDYFWKKLHPCLLGSKVLGRSVNTKYWRALVNNNICAKWVNHMGPHISVYSCVSYRNQSFVLQSKTNDQSLCETQH